MAINRPQLTDEMIDDIAKIIAEKAKFRLKKKGYGAFVSVSEIKGVASQEMFELEAEINKRNRDGIRWEMLDIAVAYVLGLASLEFEETEI